MTICEFIKIDNNKIKCIRCGNVLEILDEIDDFPVFPCFGSLADPLKATLSDAEKIKNQAAEVAPSGLNAMDMCSTDQVLARYKICGSCEFFDNNTCTKCGCLLSRDRVFMSKLSWKDAECPEKKWSKLD